MRRTSRFPILGLGIINQVGILSGDIISPEEEGGSPVYYQFNGVDRFATLDNPWVSYGFPVTISTTVVPTVVNGGLGYIISDDLDLFYTRIQNDSVEAAYATSTTDATIDSAAVPQLVIDRPYKIVINLLGPDQSEAYLEVAGIKHYVDFSVGDVEAIQNPLKWIGVRNNSTAFLNAGVKNIAIINEAPIQGREYQKHDGSTNRIATLDTPISIDGNFPISIELDMVYVRNALRQGIYSEAGVGANCQIELITSTGSIQWALGGSSVTFSNDPFSAVQDGAHIKVRFESDGPNAQRRVYVNDQQVSANSNVDWTDRKGNISRIAGGPGAATNLFNDAMANLKVVTATDIPTDEHGFLPYGSDDPTVIDFFDGTTSDTSNFVVDTGQAVFSAAGMDISGVLVYAQWPSSYLDQFNLMDTGLTLQFEIEKGAVDTFLVGAIEKQTLAGVRSTGKGAYILRNTDNSCYSIWTSLFEPGGIKTLGTDYAEDYVRVDLDVDFTLGKQRLYLNQFLVWETDIPSGFTSDINVSLGGIPLFTLLNMDFNYRNVQLSKYPITAQNTQSVYYLGDSNGGYGSYQIDNGDPYNEAAITEGPAIATYQLGTIPIIHSGYNQHGTSVENNKITSLWTGGCSVVSWNTEALYGTGEPLNNTFKNRVDELPITHIDSIVVSLIDNDILWLSAYNADKPADFVAQIEVEYKAQLDRLIANNTPHSIIVVGPSRAYVELNPNGSTEGDATLVPELVEPLRTMMQALQGYGGVVEYVDPYVGMTRSMKSDGLHYNTEGTVHVGNLVLDAVKLTTYPITVYESTYTYPMSKEGTDTLLVNTDPSTGDAYNGTWAAVNWVDIPTNSRRYNMNEGSGLSLWDSLHPDDAFYKATLNSADGWT